MFSNPHIINYTFIEVGIFFPNPFNMLYILVKLKCVLKLFCFLCITY